MKTFSVIVDVKGLTVQMTALVQLDLEKEIMEQVREQLGLHAVPKLVRMQAVPSCEGCRESQPNQEAHMYFGGCLYEEE